jgi:alkylhydroperoxidase family enzyme
VTNPDGAAGQPRIPPLEPHELSDEALELATMLRGAFGLKTEEVPKVAATMIRHPGWYRAHVEFVAQRSKILVTPARARELAILRTAWLCHSGFLWGEHVKLAKKAGVTSEEIDRVTRGSSEPGWDAFDRAVLRAAEELRENAIVSDATWEVLARHLNDQQLIEFLSMIGSHTEIAYIYNSIRVELMPGNPGLSAR